MKTWVKIQQLDKHLFSIDAVIANKIFFRIEKSLKKVDLVIQAKENLFIKTKWEIGILRETISSVSRENFAILLDQGNNFPGYNLVFIHAHKRHFVSVPKIILEEEFLNSKEPRKKVKYPKNKERFLATLSTESVIKEYS